MTITLWLITLQILQHDFEKWYAAVFMIMIGPACVDLVERYYHSTASLGVFYFASILQVYTEKHGETKLHI